MSKHTPGPWEADNICRVIAPQHSAPKTPEHPCFVVAQVGIYVGAGPESMEQEEMKANARLIAAAPKMFGYIKRQSEMLGDGVATDLLAEIEEL